MKSSLEKTSNLGRKLTIEVSADKVSSAFERVYKGLQRNANIKGFRKGKAPIQMIKNMYSDRVHQDVLQDLISLAYNDALGEHKLEPVSQPKVNFSDLSESAIFNFTAEFEVRPQIDVKTVKGLKIEKEILDVGPEKVESILSQIRESQSELIPLIEIRPAKKDDVVKIDFVGTIDGQPLEGGSMNGYNLQLGSNSFIPGFEDGVIGMNIGEKREINLNFPTDYNHKEIAGKPVKFEVSLKEILKKQLPELTDEFAKKVGGYSTVNELKDVILQDAKEQENRRVQEELKARLLKILAKENPVEVPDSLLIRQKSILIADVQKRMTEQGMSSQDFEDYKNKWDTDFTTTATFMVQTGFLIEAIAEQNDLSATNAELNERMERYAKQSGIEVNKVKDFYLSNLDRKNNLKYQITEEKVVAFILEHADIKEVPRSKLEKTDA